MQACVPNTQRDQTILKSQSLEQRKAYCMQGDGWLTHEEPRTP